MRSRDTRLMACEDAPQVVYVNCLRSFTEEASIMLWGFWDWTGQVWMMLTYNSASVKVITFNLFLKPYQVTD